MERFPRQCLNQLSQYTADFIKSKTGKGPKDIKIGIVNNKIFIEMYKVLTPMEMEIASIPEEIIHVRLARERFFEKYSKDYYSITEQLLNCTILYGISIWNIPKDEAYVVLTLQES